MDSLFCVWRESEGAWKCGQCGAIVPMTSPGRKPFAACVTGAASNGVQFRSMAKAKRLPAFAPKDHGRGPGTELKKLLSRVGIRSEPGCKCNTRAMQMDAWGPDICERKIAEIVGWLREEAVSRRLPFFEAIATAVVRSAIKRARKNAS